jgi:hypothetical protein
LIIVITGNNAGEDEDTIREQIQWLRRFRKAGRASTEQESGKTDFKG